MKCSNKCKNTARKRSKTGEPLCISCKLKEDKEIKKHETDWRKNKKKIPLERFQVD